MILYLELIYTHSNTVLFFAFISNNWNISEKYISHGIYH